MIPMMTDPCVTLVDVSKRYGKGATAVHALREVSVTLPRGSFTAVMGPSGSGKSTFLHCAAGLDLPTSGQITLGDTDLTGMREVKLTELRRERVGFIFQSFNLIPSLSVLNNITLPMRLAGHRPDRAWLHEVIERVGLGERTTHRPAQLSGGQQQRVAIARALVARPDVIFADEPTGALDSATGHDVLMLLRNTVDQMHQSVVMVTHDPVAAAIADHVLFLADGEIAGVLGRPSTEAIAARMSDLRTGTTHAHARV
ncbi:putative ABC transport system ATP-binding protein [Antricoccus suffuscus]|uniref:Putative ABC transport system ATP-binding protein n=1 Tax=Antricoccus suffuscus TaxID=1629062 RepID=A0A2T1A7B4_9ACTN|nr:ABC transporter ATP-binding protein [Antricoccus suffuscus]PRZ44228.1 putative ABC transport system ATP-binding protein [Antricoccus suffuscus]